MVNIKKVSRQILDDGLYNTLLFEIKDELLTKNVTPEAIENILKQNPSYIKEYKDINRQSELSSIQVKKLHVKDQDGEFAKELKERINDNVQILKNLENFEVDSKNSAYSIWIGSLGISIIFILHNIFALFSDMYATDEGIVYSSFALISVLTYMAYYKIKKSHDMKHLHFQKIYDSTKEMLDTGFRSSVFTYDEVYE